MSYEHEPGQTDRFVKIDLCTELACHHVRRNVFNLFIWGSYTNLIRFGPMANRVQPQKQICVKCTHTHTSYIFSCNNWTLNPYLHGECINKIYHPLRALFMNFRKFRALCYVCCIQTVRCIYWLQLAFGGFCPSNLWCRGTWTFTIESCKQRQLKNAWPNAIDEPISKQI